MIFVLLAVLLEKLDVTLTHEPLIRLGERPLRGALVGAGGIALYHMRAWQSVPGVEIGAIADPLCGRAVSLADEFGIATTFADLEELLDRVRPDFVDIATPPHVHLANVISAAERRVHVLCQKPLATSLDEARQMIGICNAAGVRCVVNENWRWRRWYREMKRLIDAGAIGDPRSARFTWHGDHARPGTDGSPPLLVAQQPYAAEQPRLIVFEWGIHLIDVLRFLFGDVERVSARMSRTSPAVRGEDTAILTLEFERGVTGTIDISWGTRVPPERRFVRGMVEPFVVEGGAGAIALDPFDDDALIILANGQRMRSDARSGLTRAEAYQECFKLAQGHFIECLRSGRPAENEAADNWNTLAAVFAAYEAAKGGGTVSVEVAKL